MSAGCSAAWEHFAFPWTCQLHSRSMLTSAAAALRLRAGPRATAAAALAAGSWVAAGTALATALAAGASISSSAGAGSGEEPRDQAGSLARGPRAVVQPPLPHQSLPDPAEAPSGVLERVGEMVQVGRVGWMSEMAGCQLDCEAHPPPHQLHLQNRTAELHGSSARPPSSPSLPCAARMCSAPARPAPTPTIMPKTRHGLWWLNSWRAAGGSPPWRPCEGWEACRGRCNGP